MLRESVEEYQEVCVQVRETNASVVRHSSLVIVISTTAAAGIIAAVAEAQDDKVLFVLPVVLISIAVMTEFIQMIINYKCRSHNRIAGYRGLIASEKFDNEGEIPSDVREKFDPAVSFDVCMDHMNNAYAKGEIDLSFVEGERFARKGVFLDLADDPEAIDRFVLEAYPSKLTIFGKNIENITRHDAAVRGGWGAFLALVRLVAGASGRRRGTWDLPLYVNAMISTIVLVEIIGSVALLLIDLFNTPGTNGVGANYRYQALVCAIYIPLLVLSVLMLYKISLQIQ